MHVARRLQDRVQDALAEFPAVALLGPRQVGKTTLAHAIGAKRPSLYLDLESPASRVRLEDPEAYLARHADKLVILDEVQRMPELFQILRGQIDARIQSGERAGHFLLLGSASLDLLQQSGESLAGRIAFLELTPLDVLEAGADVERLWMRGGFPRSFLAGSDAESARWRENFIRTYLERDIPLLGPRIPAETLRRFWTMLAHQQGTLVNAAQLARALAVDGKTVARYLDLLVDLLLVRRLPAYHANTGKRLVKSPKVYVRDSGLVHTLLQLDAPEAVLGHPVAGPSWEGFVVENLLRAAPERTEACFYQTAAGAEMDLVLDLPGRQRIAIEIKRGLAPQLTPGFYRACEDLAPTQVFMVHGGAERFPKTGGVEAIGLAELCAELRDIV